MRKLTKNFCIPSGLLDSCNFLVSLLAMSSSGVFLSLSKYCNCLGFRHARVAIPVLAVKRRACLQRASSWVRQVTTLTKSYMLKKSLAGQQKSCSSLPAKLKHEFQCTSVSIWAWEIEITTSFRRVQTLFNLPCAKMYRPSMFVLHTRCVNSQNCDIVTFWTWSVHQKPAEISRGIKWAWCGFVHCMVLQENNG